MLEDFEKSLKQDKRPSETVKPSWHIITIIRTRIRIPPTSGYCAFHFFVIAGFMLVEGGRRLADQLLWPCFSDAGHMFSDAFRWHGIVGIQTWRETDHAAKKKTFGYKRFEILTAMFNGLSLVLIAAMIFLRQSNDCFIRRKF